MRTWTMMNGKIGVEILNRKDKEQLDMSLVMWTKKRDFAMMERVLGMRADINSCISGMSVLHVAVIMDDDRLAGWLVAHGALPNVQDRKNGRTPLHYAMERGNAALALNLLEMGGDILVADKQGRFPMDLVPCGDLNTFLAKMAQIRSGRAARAQKPAIQAAQVGAPALRP